MNLELAILKVLADRQKAIPIAVIVFAAREVLGEEPTHTDTLLALKRLEKKDHVRGTNSDDFGIVWKITDDGRLRAV